MPTFTTVNAQWTNAVAVSDADDRRINAGIFVGDGTTLGTRGGVVRHSDTSLAVTVNGSDQVTVQAGVCVIPSSTALAGAYLAAFGAVTGPGAGTALTARNATNPRIDLIVVDISAGTARIRTVDGTPSSSPVAPALPSGSIELARVTVPAVGGGAVTVDSSFRGYATAIGGDLPVETAARLPGSGNQKGQRAIALDTGLYYYWSGTDWVTSRNPAGTLGYGQTTTNQTGITTTATDLTGLTVAVTVAANRRVRVSAFVNISMLTAGARVTLRIQEGATSLAAASEDISVNNVAPINLSAVLTPSSGAHTYKATAVCSPGASVTVSAASGEPCYLLVEDIGAV